MASREEWCADKLSKLLDEDLRITTLTEIREHFHEISNSEATQTAELLQLPLVFDCLNDSNNEQVDLACEVLSMCMEKLDIAQTTSRYSIPLERALTHPNAGVKLMALEEVARIMKCEPARKQALIHELNKRPLFTNIIKCIGDADLKVASRASFITTSFATIATDSILTATVLGVIQETMAINEVVRLRFYEIFVDVCICNRESHNKIISAGLLNSMMHEIDSKDVLLRLNIIEMLYKLVDREYGYNYLETEGFMDKLFRQFSDDPIFVQLCEPGILKFLGHMAYCKPNEVFNRYPQVVDRVFENLDSSDYTILKVSLETLAFISTNNKTALDSFAGAQMARAIRLIADRLQSLPTKEKVMSLSWLEALLTVPSDDEHGSKIARKWFGLFGGNPMDLVMHFVRNPFEELRLAGLGLLLAISGHKWGQEEIKNFPGLVEFLLDRSAETSKTAKDKKFDIIQTLHESNFHIFSHATMTLFEAYVKEGPHHIVTVIEVAIEGND